MRARTPSPGWCAVPGHGRATGLGGSATDGAERGELTIDGTWRGVAGDKGSGSRQVVCTGTAAAHGNGGSFHAKPLLLVAAPLRNAFIYLQLTSQNKSVFLVTLGLGREIIKELAARVVDNRQSRLVSIWSEPM